MIRDMRDSISSWPIRIVLILLIFSFISFYGWNRNQGGLKPGDVASVNGESISNRDFSFRYQNLIQSYQRQGRLPTDVPESIYSMLKEQLLGSMIYQKVKSSEASKLHLRASNDKVKENIKKEFSDSQGNFDFRFYDSFLRNQMGKTPGTFENEERENLRAQLYEQFLLETAVTSTLQLKQSYALNNEKVSLDYLKLNEKNSNAAVPTSKSASAEELKKFYETHQDQFKTKEKRQLDITYFEKKDFGSSTDFEKIAQEMLVAGSDKPDARLKHIKTDLITYDDKVAPLTTNEITELLNSTLNLDQGKSTILVARDGQKVFSTKLLAVETAKLPEFTQVKKQVEMAYLKDQQGLAFNKWVADSWAKISSGQMSLEDFAKKTKLNVEHTDSFAFSSTNAVPSLGSNEEIMKSAFGLTSEKPYPSQTYKVNDDIVFIKLKEKISPDWKKFESDQTNLADALTQQSAQTRFSEWMDNTEKKYKIKRELQTAQAGGPVED